MLTIAFVYFFWCPLLILLSFYRLGCHLLSVEDDTTVKVERISSGDDASQEDKEECEALTDDEFQKRWYQVVREMKRDGILHDDN